jgi:hypothetical protein
MCANKQQQHHHHHDRHTNRFKPVLVTPEAPAQENAFNVRTLVKFVFLRKTESEIQKPVIQKRTNPGQPCVDRPSYRTLEYRVESDSEKPFAAKH